MNIDPIIARLRAGASYPSGAAPFGDRVAGAAELAVAQDNDDLPVPNAFVVPLNDSPGPNISAGKVVQNNDELIAVMVCIDNTVNERGQGAAVAIEAFRLELHKALLGWQAPDADTGFVYRGGQFVEMTRARYWHQFNFEAKSTIQEL